MSDYYGEKLPCPVCGDTFKQMENHLRRKQDREHREWRNEGKAAADDQDPEPDQEVQEDPEPGNSEEGPDMFKKHGGESPGKQKGQQRQPQRKRMDMQQRIQAAKQGKEPWEHDCPEYPDNAEFYEQKDECPRCGKSLQWGALGA